MSILRGLMNKILNFIILTKMNPLLECHKRTLFRAGISIVASLMPVIFLVVILIGIRRWNGFEIFWARGDFYIFAAVFSVHSIYILHGRDEKKYSWLTLWFWLSIFILAFSSLIYGGHSLISEAQTVDPEFKIKFTNYFLKWTSLLSFFISIAIYYYSVYIDESFLYKQDKVSKDTDQADEIENLLP